MTQATSATTPSPRSQTATRWTLDGSHSSVGFSIRHMMISNVKGEFTGVQASATFDPARPEQTSVRATIDVGSINTREEKRDAHLKSADFFDVENHPEIQFESTKVEKHGGDLLVHGKLTIVGVTRHITLEVSDISAPAQDPWGNTRVGATATTKIKRSDFGITWNNVLEAGGVLVGDEVKIALDLSFVKDAS